MENKRTFFGLTSLLFLVITLPIGVVLVGRKIKPPRAAELPSPIFFAPDSGEYDVGEEFTVNIAFNTEEAVVDGVDVMVEAVNLDIKGASPVDLPDNLFFIKDPEIVGSRASFSVLADPHHRFSNNEAQTLVSLTVSGRAHCAEALLVFNKDLSVVASQGENILGTPGDASFNIQSPEGVENPEFTSPPSVTAEVNQPFFYAATATNPNNDTLVYTYSNLPDWLITEGATVSGTPTVLGTYLVGIIVEDGGGGSACLALTIETVDQEAGATLALSPEAGTFAVNSTFDLAVDLNTNGAKVLGVDVRLLYGSTQLEGLEIIPETSIFPHFFAKTIDNANGKIYIGASTSEGSYYSNNVPTKIATIRFKGVSSGPNPVKFDFTPGKTLDSNVVEHGTNLDILKSVTDGIYELVDIKKVLQVTLRMERKPRNRNNYPVVLSAKDTSWLTVFIPNADGSYPVPLEDFPGDKVGLVDFILNGYQHLQVKRTVEIMGGESGSSADFGVLPAGDIAPWPDTDNYVNVMDYSILVSEWNLLSPHDSIGDFNADLFVNSIDYSIMVNNFHREGDS